MSTASKTLAPMPSDLRAISQATAPRSRQAAALAVAAPSMP
jgi:hypothetical protein